MEKVVRVPIGGSLPHRDFALRGSREYSGRWAAGVHRIPIDWLLPAEACLGRRREDFGIPASTSGPQRFLRGDAAAVAGAANIKFAMLLFENVDPEWT